MATRWRALHRNNRQRILREANNMTRPLGYYLQVRDPQDDDLYDFDYDRDETYENDCWHCGGDGFIDGYEDDPLWYAPGELERCASCNGSGLAKDMTIW
jgi:hypothetical protein